MYFKITSKGLFIILEGFPNHEIRPIRVAAISIPNFPDYIDKKELKTGVQKDIKNAQYNSSSNSVHNFMRLRDEKVIFDTDPSLIQRFIQHHSLKQMQYLMDNGISLLMQRIDREHVLIIGLEYQPILTDLDDLVFRPSLLDVYRDLDNIAGTLIATSDGQITIDEIFEHPQVVSIDYTWLKQFIYEYSANHRLTKDIPEGLIPSDTPRFNFLRSSSQGYDVGEGKHLFVISSPQQFSEFIQNNRRQVMFGQSLEECPPGFSSVTMDQIRLDLSSILENKEDSRTLLQIFEYIMDEEGFTAAFEVTHEQFVRSVHEYSTRYNEFSKLLAGLNEAVRDNWMVDTMESLYKVMSGLSGLSNAVVFDKGKELELPQKTYIALDCDLPTATFFVLVFMYRIDIDGIDIDEYLFDFESLSILLNREQMLKHLATPTFPYWSYTVIHRVTTLQPTYQSQFVITLDHNGNKLLVTRDRSKIFESREDLPKFPVLVHEAQIWPIIPISIDLRVREKLLTSPVHIISQVEEHDDYSSYPLSEEPITAPVSESISNMILQESIETEEQLEKEQEQKTSLALGESITLQQNIPLETDPVDIDKQKENQDYHQMNIPIEVNSVNQVSPHPTTQINVNSTIKDVSLNNVNENLVEHTALPEYVLYDTLFNPSQLLDQFRDAHGILDHEEVLEGLSKMIAIEQLLLRLRQGKLKFEDTYSSNEIIRKGMAERRVDPDGIYLILNQNGESKLNERMTDLSTLANNMGDRKALEDLLAIHAEILEAQRKRGKLSYFVGLLNWAKLLSVCYFNRYSKYDPITSGFVRAFLYYLNRKQFIERAKVEKTLLLIIDEYLEHFHNIEQEIRKPYIEPTEPSKVPKPGEVLQDEPLTVEEIPYLKSKIKTVYKNILGTVYEPPKNATTTAIKRKASMQKRRKLNKIFIPRNTSNDFSIDDVFDLPVQHLKLPKKFLTFLNVVSPSMTIGEFKESNVDYSKLDFTNRTLNPVNDIRTILQGNLLTDDLLYLLDDKSLQEMFNKGLNVGYLPDEVRKQVPKRYYERFLTKDSPKLILSPLLDHLLEEYDVDGKSIDEKLQFLKDIQEKGQPLTTNYVLDLSYGLKYEELVKEDPSKLTEFVNRLRKDLDTIVLPMEKLRKKKTTTKEQELI